MALGKFLQFSDQDVRALDLALKRFADIKRTSGVPDYSANFVAYTPVLAFALLKAQQVVERLTWVLIALTVVLAILTGMVVIP